VGANAGAGCAGLDAGEVGSWVRILIRFRKFRLAT